MFLRESIRGFRIVASAAYPPRRWPRLHQSIRSCRHSSSSYHPCTGLPLLLSSRCLTTQKGNSNSESKTKKDAEEKGTSSGSSNSSSRSHDVHVMDHLYESTILTSAGLAECSPGEQYAAVEAEAAARKLQDGDLNADDMEDDDDTEEKEKETLFREEKKEEELQKERLRMAADSLRSEKLLSSENIHKYVHMTEVTTPTGVRWLDLYGKSALFENKILARQSEGAFAASVLRALHHDTIPAAMYTSLSRAGGLPSVFVEENWVCLVLRTAKEDFPDFAGGSGQSTDSSNARVQHSAASMNPRRMRRLRKWKLGKTEYTAEKYHYDEETDSFQRNTPDDSLFSIFGSLRRRCQAVFPRKKQLNRHTHLLSHTAPTLTEATERLSVLLLKELHPIELDAVGCDPHRSSGNGSGSSGASTPPCDVPFADNIQRITRVDKTEETSPHGTQPRQPAAPKGGEQQQGDASSSSSSSSSQSTTQPAEKQFVTRWRIVTIHRQRIPLIEETLGRWGEFLQEGGRLRGDPESPDRTFYINRNAESIGWEEIVRHLVRETARDLQKSNIHHSRILEQTESAIFGEDGQFTAAKMRTMRQTLGNLHVLSRTADMHTSILREMRVSYEKLKKVLGSPLNGADRKELLYLDSALSLGKNLEEQSRSLLVLQFSVAMNFMERNLRTLTIFTTFFIPLEVIVNCGGTDFADLEDFYEDPKSFYLVMASIVITSLATYRWIKRNIS